MEINQVCQVPVTHCNNSAITVGVSPMKRSRNWTTNQHLQQNWCRSSKLHCWLAAAMRNIRCGCRLRCQHRDEGRCSRHRRGLNRRCSMHWQLLSHAAVLVQAHGGRRVMTDDWKMDAETTLRCCWTGPDVISTLSHLPCSLTPTKVRHHLQQLCSAAVLRGWQKTPDQTSSLIAAHQSFYVGCEICRLQIYRPRRRSAASPCWPRALPSFSASFHGWWLLGHPSHCRGPLWRCCCRRRWCCVEPTVSDCAASEMTTCPALRHHFHSVKSVHYLQPCGTWPAIIQTIKK